MTLQIRIVDGETITDRDMNEAELAIYAASEAQAQAEAQAELDKASARQIVLDRLGITADEAALLLG